MQDTATPRQHWTIDPRQTGVRLDVFLAERLDLSRRSVIDLLERGGVIVSGRATDRSDKGRFLQAGDRVEVASFVPPGDRVIQPNPRVSLDVAAQGADWLVVNKPAGVAVHPLFEDQTDTVMNGVAAGWPGVSGVGEGGLRSGVVHRLDVGTSGALLVALTEQRWQRCRKAFNERRVEKHYRAIVAGRLEGAGELVRCLRVAQHRPARVRVVAEDRVRGDTDVRRCLLHWRTIETFSDTTLVEVELITGFLHQIRVMMADLGHPIVGDGVYGWESQRHASGLNPSHPMLHAERLRVDDIAARCAPPEDFEDVLSRCR